jgi:hypothetical protein
MPPIKFSFFVSLIISFAFLLITFWIFYAYSWNADAAKDALSTTGSFFGAGATLGAAIIAAFLFNDWKDQHNKQVLAYEAKENFMLIHKERDIIHKLKFTCTDISQGNSNKYITWHSFSENFDKELLGQFNKNKDAMVTFCFLAHEQSIYNLLLEYRSEIEVITNFLIEKKKEQYSDFTAITEEDAANTLELLTAVETKNENVLNELKTYIFVK